MRISFFTGTFYGLSSFKHVFFCSRAQCFFFCTGRIFTFTGKKTAFMGVGVTAPAWFLLNAALDYAKK